MRKQLTRKKSLGDMTPEDTLGTTDNTVANEQENMVAQMRGMTDKATKALGAALDDGNHKEATTAAKIVLEYGYGKPKESIEIDGNLRIDADELINALHRDRAKSS